MSEDPKGDELAALEQRTAQQLAELQALREERKRKTHIEAPAGYGLPDLLAPVHGEDAEAQRQRQDAALKEFIEARLWFEKDGVRTRVKTIPPMLEFIADLFYKRVNLAILWKPRGGGGSLAVAVVIWLFMVYHRKSWMDLAGSGKQAKVVYNYVSDFWGCFPGMEQRLVVKNLMSDTQLANGAQLVCVACSEKAVRGEHRGGIALDEACQKDEGTSTRFDAALQGMFSERDPLAIMTSTFHWPFGFFQEHWDEAAAKGFKRYRWNIFETMRRCARGMETATPEDPQALGYCRNNCPLTERREVRDAQGVLLETLYEECNGQARASDGFASFENVLMAKTMNSAGPTWRVEFCCQRPQVRGSVYAIDAVERAAKKTVQAVEGGRKTVGLDWGLMTQAVAVMVEEGDRRLVVPRVKVFEGESVQQIADLLVMWHETHGPLVVYADAEEAYGNQALALAGLTVFPVHFSKFKDYGVSNLALWLEYGKLDILDVGDAARVLIPQLKKLHRNKLGTIRKVDDHAPDAAMCAVLSFNFMEMVGRELRKNLRRQAETGETEPEYYAEADATIEDGLGEVF